MSNDKKTDLKVGVTRRRIPSAIMLLVKRLIGI